MGELGVGKAAGGIGAREHDGEAERLLHEARCTLDVFVEEVGPVRGSVTVRRWFAVARP